MKPQFTVPSRARAVRYMERTRNYYRAMGYPTDYVWAHNDSVPFARPTKPLSESCVAVITTASPAGTTKQTIPEVWSADADQIPASLYTENRAWDKETTHTDDTETFLPLRALRTLVELGELGSVAPRYFGVPSEYSQRNTIEHDAPEVLQCLQEDGADIALLVPL